MKRALQKALDALSVVFLDPTIRLDPQTSKQVAEARWACVEAQTHEGTAKDLAERIHRFINVMGGNAGSDELIRLITGDHRTLQQAVFRDLIVPMIDRWAEMEADGYWDDRNEGTVKACAAIVAGENWPPPLPMI